MQQKTRAFLKWAGGKYSLVEDISKRLQLASYEADTLVEPFVGAGSVFLNTQFKHYVLNDINADLINLYKELKRIPDEFIADAKRLFVDLNNHPDAYYAYRQQFNESIDVYERAILFLYMNRHAIMVCAAITLKVFLTYPLVSIKNLIFQSMNYTCLLRRRSVRLLLVRATVKYLRIYPKMR